MGYPLLLGFWQRLKMSSTLLCPNLPMLRPPKPYSSPVAKVIAQYSASALDLATTSYFLLFQDIRLFPMSTQYLEVECLSEGKLVQSASQ